MIFGFFCPCCTRKKQIEGKKISLRRAPEPTDVIWLNICYTKFQKYISRIITSIITLILIAGGFAVIVGISYGQVRKGVL